MHIKEPEIKPEEILILKDKDFTPKNVCIVTGCCSGIGKAMAIAAYANGLTVVGLDINADAWNGIPERIRSIGGQMVFIETDLCDDEQVEHAVIGASTLGNIKYLANIAGIQRINSIENFLMEDYDLMQKVMLRAPFYLSKLVIPHMKDANGGVIGNMASVHAHICTKNKPAYNIMKFGLKALSQSISAEGQGKIRSFTVSTGFVKTALALNQIPAQARQRRITPEEVVRDVMMGKSRIKEMMSPIEVANQFIYGFSKYSKYLVGGDMLFDGGMVLTY